MLGGLIAGVLGLATIAAYGQRAPLIVGGVDLSGVDMSKPFWVDFSVADTAPAEVKRRAMARLMKAAADFRSAFPNWATEPNIDARAGRFVLVVSPLQHPAQQVTRSLMTS